MSRLFFPAHTSYFEDKFTQAEVDAAVKAVQFHFLSPLKGCSLVMVTEPGRFTGVIFDGVGNEEIMKRLEPEPEEVTRFKEWASHTLEFNFNIQKKWAIGYMERMRERNKGTIL